MEDWFQVPLLLFTSFLLLVYSFFFFRNHGNPRNLPPAPPKLPIIGHLHLLKQPLHRTLQELASKYGPVLLLKFGYRKVLVISSASTAEECFTKYDVVFADRPRTLASEILNYESTTVVFAPYGESWRNLRRLLDIGVFSTKSLAASSSIREDEACLLVKQLFDESGGKVLRVKLRSKLVDLAFNIVMRVLVDKRYYGKDVISEEGRQFKEMIREFGELHGSASNLGDFIPILGKIDLQGVKKQMINTKKKTSSFLQHLVDVRRTSIGSSVRSFDADKTGGTSTGATCLTDRILSLQQDEPGIYSDTVIKGILQVILLAGIDTTSTTLEWAMALLLNHPEALARVQVEIDSVVGYDRLVDESDLQNLTYLQNVITETLRLFPPVPLLLPHESSADSTISGFHIPRGTMLIMNSWSIQRDPEIWADPEKFAPERFQHIGSHESGCKWIPFGVGKRACPGAMFGKRVVALVLGAMVQCFEWRKVGAEAIDMAGSSGITMLPVTPVEALCKPRETMIQLLSNLELNNELVGDAE